MKPPTVFTVSVAGLAALGLLTAMSKVPATGFGLRFNLGDHLQHGFPSSDERHPVVGGFYGPFSDLTVEVPYGAKGQKYVIDCSEFDTLGRPPQPSRESRSSDEHLSYYKFHVCYWENSVAYWSDQVDRAQNENEQQEFENAKDLSQTMLKTATTVLTETIQARTVAGLSN